MRGFSMDYIFHKRARRVFLVPTEGVHGMVRMFSILSDFESDVIQKIRDMAETRRWFGFDLATNSN